MHDPLMPPAASLAAPLGLWYGAALLGRNHLGKVAVDLFWQIVQVSSPQVLLARCRDLSLVAERRARGANYQV